MRQTLIGEEVRNNDLRLLSLRRQDTRRGRRGKAGAETASGGWAEVIGICPDPAPDGHFLTRSAMQSRTGG